MFNRKACCSDLLSSLRGLLVRSSVIFFQSAFSSVQSLSCVWLFATPWTAALQASLSITNSRSSPKLISIESVMPSNHLILRHPPLLLPSILCSIRVFPNESSLHIKWTKYQKELQLQHQSFQWIFRVVFLNWLVWSCSPRDSQESSPVPQFINIDSSAVSLPYGPTLTSIHDYWKNHSFDYMDLCRQSDVSAF